jgi:hypothetical protein
MEFRNLFSGDAVSMLRRYSGEENTMMQNNPEALKHIIAPHFIFHATE